jgi:hypothetical protein
MACAFFTPTPFSPILINITDKFGVAVSLLVQSMNGDLIWNNSKKKFKKEKNKSIFFAR